jgi:hypothetical protein
MVDMKVYSLMIANTRRKLAATASLVDVSIVADDPGLSQLRKGY